jgi:hypothetical protein
MIIAVGYRINSKKATNFRRWATKVLKEYVHHGYTINSQKITVNRFTNLENEVKDRVWYFFISGCNCLEVVLVMI